MGAGVDTDAHLAPTPADGSFFQRSTWHGSTACTACSASSSRGCAPTAIKASPICIHQPAAGRMNHQALPKRWKSATSAKHPAFRWGGETKCRRTRMLTVLRCCPGGPARCFNRQFRSQGERRLDQFVAQGGAQLSSRAMACSRGRIGHQKSILANH
jgi:hypothetical protein